MSKVKRKKKNFQFTFGRLNGPVCLDVFVNQRLELSLQRKLVALQPRLVSQALNPLTKETKLGLSITKKECATIRP